MKNPTIQDITNLLKKSTNYEFHYSIWVSFFNNVDYDANVLHRRLKKFEKNGYFVEFKEIYNYNPIIKAVVTANALSNYFDNIDVVVADAMAQAFMQDLHSSYAADYQLNIDLFLSIINSLDCETFFEKGYKDFSLFLVLIGIDPVQNFHLANAIFNPNNKSKTFKVGKAYAFWTMVILDFHIGNDLLDFIFKDPEMVINELYVEDLKALLKNPRVKIKEMPSIHTLKSRDTIKDVMKYIKSRNDLELLLRLHS
jgi:DNA-binding Lrp family transcriptional regulator